MPHIVPEVIVMRLPLWIFAVIAILPVPGLADAPTDFSGEWSASGVGGADTDNAPTPEPARPGDHGSGRHGGHGGMGGMSGGHHRQQSSNASGDSAHGANAPENPRLKAHTLIIRQSEVVFDIAADGQRMVYRFDNRNNYGAAYGGTVTLTWSAPEMVIETHPDTGGTIVERYTLSNDGKQLTLRTSTQRAGDNTESEFKRVFARSDAASSSPAP
jgi:hypothetical protein